jgi:hypothetical protein
MDFKNHWKQEFYSGEECNIMAKTKKREKTGKKEERFNER